MKVPHLKRKSGRQEVSQAKKAAVGERGRAAEEKSSRTRTLLLRRGPALWGP